MPREAETCACGATFTTGPCTPYSVLREWRQAHAACRLVQRCPVCGGRGTVPTDFYTGFGASSSTAAVTCQSCTGRGIIHG